VKAFVRKFGYADKNDKPGLNFGGRRVVGVECRFPNQPRSAAVSNGPAAAATTGQWV